VVYLKALAVLALLGAISWCMYEPGFEQVLAVIGAVATLLSLFVVERKEKRRRALRQTVLRSSTGIQAGGDIHIGTIRGDNREK
jgi:hypothetical protein